MAEKLITVSLNRDHWHAGEFYAAGEPIEVSVKRRQYFEDRKWLKSQKQDSSEEGKNK